MKVILLISALLPYHLSAGPQLLKVRELYSKAALSEESCKELMQMVENDRSALFSGYYAVSKMMMAQYLFNPVNKLSYFNSGRSLLDEAIKREPGNTELRFLRFSVQSNAPAFLNYRSELNTDKKAILSVLPALRDAGLKNMIVSYLRNSDELSKEEKAKLN